MEKDNQKYTIRPLISSDANSLAKYADNIAIWNNLRDRFPHPYTEKDAMTYISYATNEVTIEKVFAIVIENKAVGVIGYIPGQDVERLGAEIGYWLGQDYWNKGLMSHLITNMVSYIFANTEIIRLFAVPFEHNFASQRVLEKAGFRKITTLSKAVIKNNKILDMQYYELLKDI